MQILLFDMDGVLLKPKGYHQALIETVRRTSQSLGFEEILLSQQDVSQFESLGISNEWHSSAMCMALMVIQAQKRNIELNLSPKLRLNNTNFQSLEFNMASLYTSIAAQPIELPALSRAYKAIELVARSEGVDPTISTSIVEGCEQIEHSLTLNIFQELVLGSAHFEETYAKKSQLGTKSYLKIYDTPLISPETKATLTDWLQDPFHHAAIMTNRPSNTLLGPLGTPEAELGAALVGLEFLPIIGSGEMLWLANETGQAVSNLVKPSPHHALSAIFAAFGFNAAEALRMTDQILAGNVRNLPISMDGCKISVFEDTPGGILAVESAKQILKSLNHEIQIEKVGIATDAKKRQALSALGAAVYRSIDDALLRLG